jgi:hypothetical protein
MSLSSIDVAFDTILYAVAARYALPAYIASDLPQCEPLLGRNAVELQDVGMF